MKEELIYSCPQHLFSTFFTVTFYALIVHGVFSLCNIICGRNFFSSLLTQNAAEVVQLMK